MTLTYSLDMNVSVEFELLEQGEIVGPIFCRTDVEELAGVFASNSGRLPHEVLQLSYNSPEVSCDFAVSDGPPLVAAVRLLPAPDVCGEPATPDDTMSVVESGVVCSAQGFPDILSEVRGEFIPVVTVLVETLP